MCTQQLQSIFFVAVLLVPSTFVASSPTINTRLKPDNETVYRVSKSLCWGCIGESIQFLFAHNMVRASHWELPLAWDFELEKYARWWAGQRKGDCKLEHSFPEDDFKLGENVFWGSGSGWTPTDAVRAWADEVKYYTYATNTCQEDQMCGHYTQIVWSSTRRLGCARLVCDDGDTFMTCNYDPPGVYRWKPYLFDRSYPWDHQMGTTCSSSMFNMHVGHQPHQMVKPIGGLYVSLSYTTFSGLARPVKFPSPGV